MTRAELQSIHNDFAERYGRDLARRVVRWRGYSGSASLDSVTAGNFESLACAFADVAAGRDRLPGYTPADDRQQHRRPSRTFDRKSVAPWL
ncbi:hypothetical protein [Bradyrhizobium liaoningense]|uniref:hypothetical protein n=1 Tax=Bradyrhizobium liaoningense TaxID=43992 RepID=UPI001BA9E51A|nr:hypothetical protein [Bradyrhizobium liaoningense]MBR0982342.1 hypothetical protein [Bradyrhizobium liaoningense]